MIVADLSELRQFGTALRKCAPEIAKEVGNGLKRAGELVAVEARLRSSWSTRIPRTIKTSRSNMTVKVSAGGKGAPHAAPFENEGDGGTFRHPVYGHREVWVSQRARPYLGPSLIAKASEAERLVGEALEAMFERTLR